ncbi:MAG: XRE family transcriptional regulator [Allomuricauda sp.]|nr:MAG: XRE family transcriptional regulator [Allomuricauda sp.]
MKEVGEVIKELRNRAGYSQAEFASACSISPSYMSQIESGRLPHLNNLRKIAEVLDIPVQLIYFLSLKPENIKEEKREAFELIFPAVKEMMVKTLMDN